VSSRAGLLSKLVPILSPGDAIEGLLLTLAGVTDRMEAQ
jgi:hypothetical protein